MVDILYGCCCWRPLYRFVPFVQMHFIPSHKNHVGQSHKFNPQFSPFFTLSGLGKYKGGICGKGISEDWRTFAFFLTNIPFSSWMVRWDSWSMERAAPSKFLFYRKWALMKVLQWIYWQADGKEPQKIGTRQNTKPELVKNKNEVTRVMAFGQYRL